MANDPWQEQFEAYLIDIAGQQLDVVGLELKNNPEAYPEFTQAAQWLDAMEAPLEAGRDCEMLAHSEAWMAYAAALAIEMYLHGARDGGRIYHAFITNELPTKKDGP